MHKFVLFLLLLPLAACNDNSLTQLLNGRANASSGSDRTPYVPGSTATQAEVDRLHYFAPGQSTYAMHHVMGVPDSTTPQADYYLAPDGQTLVEVPYDANGKWTGQIQSVPAPQWQASPYPGAN